MLLVIRAVLELDSDGELLGVVDCEGRLVRGEEGDLKLLSGALDELVNRFSGSVKVLCCADSRDCMAGLSLLVGEALRWEENLWPGTVLLLVCVAGGGCSVNLSRLLLALDCVDCEGVGVGP